MSKKDTIKNAFDYDEWCFDKWWAGLNDEEREMIKERIKEYDQTIELNKKQKEKDIKDNLNLYVGKLGVSNPNVYIYAKNMEDITEKYKELLLSVRDNDIKRIDQYNIDIKDIKKVNINSKEMKELVSIDGGYMPYVILDDHNIDDGICVLRDFVEYKKSQTEDNDS